MVGSFDRRYVEGKALRVNIAKHGFLCKSRMSASVYLCMLDGNLLFKAGNACCMGNNNTKNSLIN